MIQKEVNVFLIKFIRQVGWHGGRKSHGLCTTPTFDALGSVDTDTHGSTIFSNRSFSPAFLKGMALKTETIGVKLYYMNWLRSVPYEIESWSHKSCKSSKKVLVKESRLPFISDRLSRKSCRRPEANAFFVCSSLVMCFLVKMWSSFCQRSSQLVFASCILVVGSLYLFWGGRFPVSFILVILVNSTDFVEKSEKKCVICFCRNLWLKPLPHTKLFFGDLSLAGLGEKPGVFSAFLVRQKGYKNILKWDGWSIDCMQIYEMHNQNAYLLSIWVNCKNLQPNFWRAGHLLNYTIQAFTERRGPKNRHCSLFSSDA